MFYPGKGHRRSGGGEDSKEAGSEEYLLSPTLIRKRRRMRWRNFSSKFLTDRVLRSRVSYWLRVLTRVQPESKKRRGISSAA